MFSRSVLGASICWRHSVLKIVVVVVVFAVVVIHEKINNKTILKVFVHYLLSLHIYFFINFIFTLYLHYLFFIVYYVYMDRLAI